MRSRQFIFVITTLTLSPLFPCVIPAQVIAQTITPSVEQTTNSDLSGQVWQLQEIRYSNDEVVRPDDPSRYTLEFQNGGEVLIQADCNQGGGTYTQQNPQLSIRVGRLTRVACPPGSMADRYLRDLSRTASYMIQDGTLYVSLMVDTGIMVFAPATVSAQPLPVNPSTPIQLVGSTWKLRQIIVPGDRIVTITDPTKYTLTFDAEGNIGIRADCNSASGSYIQDGNQLTLMLGPTTLAACPPNSLADHYLQYLSRASRFSIQFGQLQIELQQGISILSFEPSP